MRNLSSHKVVSGGLIMIFLISLLARDIFGVAIPLNALTAIWILGLLAWSNEESVAFTVAATICFANSVSITIPIFAFLLILLFKNKVLYISTVLLLSVFIMGTEMSKFIMFSDQSFKLYVNYVMIIMLVAIVITFQLKASAFNPVLILKFYLGAFVFLSLDILILTVKNYGSVSSILGSSFRIGQTNFVEEATASTMSINANGVGLLAILAVAVAFVLLRYNHIRKKTAYIVIIYSSIIGFMTISKTFFLIYIIMMTLFVLENVRTNARNPIKLLALILAIVVAYFVFIQTSIYSNIMYRFETGDLTTGRFDITQQYFDFMNNNAEYQLFGVGLQNVNIKAGIVNVPHNALLEIYVTLGIVGLLIYIIFFYSIVHQSKLYNYKEFNSITPFINFIPFITYLLFTQALQFLRISYIYSSIIIIVMCLLVRDKDSMRKCMKKPGVLLK